MPVPALNPSSEDMNRLRRAAGMLTGIGRVHPDPAVALLCLAAAEDLARLGVQPPRVVVGPADAATAADDALASLTALPDDIFAATAVLDAAANVRAARALLGESG